MKKILMISLALATLLVLSACSSSGDAIRGARDEGEQSMELPIPDCIEPEQPPFEFIEEGNYIFGNMLKVYELTDIQNPNIYTALMPSLKIQGNLKTGVKSTYLSCQLDDDDPSTANDVAYTSGTAFLDQSTHWPVRGFRTYRHLNAFNIEDMEKYICHGFVVSDNDQQVFSEKTFNEDKYMFPAITELEVYENANGENIMIHVEAREPMTNNIDHVRIYWAAYNYDYGLLGEGDWSESYFDAPLTNFNEFINGSLNTTNVSFYYVNVDVSGGDELSSFGFKYVYPNQNKQTTVLKTGEKVIETLPAKDMKLRDEDWAVIEQRLLEEADPHY